MAWHFEPGHACTAKVNQFLIGHWDGFAQDHEHHADLAHALVGQGHHMGLQHRRVCDQQVFHFGGHDQLAPAAVGLFAPTDQQQVVVGVDTP